LKLTVHPDAFQNSSIGIGVGTLSVIFVVPPLTNIFVAIGSGEGTLSVETSLMTILPSFTDIFVAIGKGVRALGKTVTTNASTAPCVGRYSMLSGLLQSDRLGSSSKPG